MDEPKADPKIVIRSRVPKFNVKFEVYSLKPSLESDESTYYRLFYFFKSHQTINKGQVLVIMMLVIRMVR